MWPFLFIIALVPLVFFWSDSAVEMFPQMQQYLPKKAAPPKAATPGQEQVPGVANVADAYGRWYESRNQSGYVAFTLSADGQYRLSVGCRPEMPASLQVTHALGHQMKEDRSLNYHFGKLSLTDGYANSPELIGAVAQFGEVLLEGPSREVFAQFKVAGTESGMVARNLQSNCVPSALPAVDPAS